jgi:hypothetical protein
MPKLFGGEIKNLSNIYKAHVIIEQSKNSQNAKNFKHRDFSRLPILGGRNEKKNQHL